MAEPGIPGLQRPVLAFRPHYEDILRNIMETEGVVIPGQVIVVGDLLEFDLLVPLRLGMRAMLVGETALEYEKQFVSSHPGGSFQRLPW
jgi:FMN phosphatase YigB (HAD superfamily)